MTPTFTLLLAYLGTLLRPRPSAPPRPLAAWRLGPYCIACGERLDDPAYHAQPSHPWQRVVGQAATEFAIVLSIAMPLAVGCLDLAWMLKTVVVANQAVSAGSVALSQGARDDAVVALVTGASLGAITPGMVTLTPGCGGRTVGVPATLSASVPLVPLTHILDAVWADRLARPLSLSAQVPTVQPCVP